MSEDQGFQNEDRDDPTAQIVPEDPGGVPGAAQPEDALRHTKTTDATETGETDYTGPTGETGEGTSVGNPPG